MIRTLMMCQLVDPGRGSFMVNPLAVKKQTGMLMSRGQQVYRGSHHVTRGPKGASFHPHPQAIDYIVK